MMNYFNMEETRFVRNTVTGHDAYYIISNDGESAVFFEYVRADDVPVLRCICSIDEMMDRLKMWNFSA